MRHRSAWVLPVVAAMLATGLLLGCIPWQRIELSPDGRTLYLTSEKRPTPLLEVPAVEGK